MVRTFAFESLNRSRPDENTCIVDHLNSQQRPLESKNLLRTCHPMCALGVLGLNTSTRTYTKGYKRWLCSTFIFAANVCMPMLSNSACIVEVRRFIQVTEVFA